MEDDHKRWFVVDPSHFLKNKVTNPLLRFGNQPATDEELIALEHELQIEYRPVTYSQPVDYVLEQDAALLKARSIAERDAEARCHAEAEEYGEPVTDEMLRDRVSQARRDVNRSFVRFNAPRFGREARVPIEFLVCVTMYNEVADELDKTLKGIAANAEQLRSFGIGSEHVAVVIIVDGYSNMHPSVAEYMEKTLNVYVPRMVLPTHNGRNVTCHWFERKVAITKHRTENLFYEPLQICFVIKSRNGGKLNSHLWFYRCFCELIHPSHTFLLDVGTVPRSKALRRCYRAFEENAQVAGVCGEISVRQRRVYSLVVSAQVFEYKMSHVLDKAMESMFGYITVLPGAFSAYRWKAIRGEPLSAYFKTEEEDMEDISAWEANMFLAEDRILCLEIIAKKNRDWTMHYVAGAVADTDVPEDLIGLIKQRRRWLNGAFFALLYFIQRFSGVLFSSSHSILRKLMLTVQFVYLVMLVVLNWLSPGSLYLSFYVIFDKTLERVEGGQAIMFIFSLTYIFSFLIVVIAALGNDIKAVGRLYIGVSYVYGIMGIVATILGAYHTITGTFSLLIQLISMASVLCYVISSVIHGEFLVILVVMLQYIFMLPTLVNVLPIYSFCNLHDISWGTKEGNLKAEQAREKDQARQLEENKRFIREEMAGRRGRDGDASTVAEDSQSVAGNVLQSMAELGSGAAAAQVVSPRTAAKKQNAQAALRSRWAQLQANFKLFRLRLLSLWLACNFTFVLFIVNFELLDWFLLIMLSLILTTLGYRVIGSVLYQILRLFKACVRRFCLCCFHQRKDEAAVPHTRRQTVTRARTKADFELDKERKLVYVQTPHPEHKATPASFIRGVSGDGSRSPYGHRDRRRDSGDVTPRGGSPDGEFDSVMPDGSLTQRWSDDTNGGPRRDAAIGDVKVDFGDALDEADQAVTSVEGQGAAASGLLANGRPLTGSMSQGNGRLETLQEVPEGPGNGAGGGAGAGAGARRPPAVPIAAGTDPGFAATDCGRSAFVITKAGTQSFDTNSEEGTPLNRRGVSPLTPMNNDLAGVPRTSPGTDSVFSHSTGGGLSTGNPGIRQGVSAETSMGDAHSLTSTHMLAYQAREGARRSPARGSNPAAASGTGSSEGGQGGYGSTVSGTATSFDARTATTAPRGSGRGAAADSSVMGATDVLDGVSEYVGVGAGRGAREPVRVSGQARQEWPRGGGRGSGGGGSDAPSRGDVYDKNGDGMMDINEMFDGVDTGVVGAGERSSAGGTRGPSGAGGLGDLDLDDGDSNSHGRTTPLSDSEQDGDDSFNLDDAADVRFRFEGDSAQGSRRSMHSADSRPRRHSEPAVGSAHHLDANARGSYSTRRRR